MRQLAVVRSSRYDMATTFLSVECGFPLLISQASANTSQVFVPFLRSWGSLGVGRGRPRGAETIAP